MVMSFRERMEYLEEMRHRNSKDTHADGTYVAVELDARSRKALDSWVSQHNIPNAADPNQYHVTVIYSRKGVPEVKSYDFNLPIEGTISGWKLFPTANGKNCLVAIIDAPELEKHHKTIRSELGATHDYPNYQPHVTISYDYAGRPPTDTPDIKLKFSKVKIESLDPEVVPAKKSER